jgi:hypothetical protein
MAEYRVGSFGSCVPHLVTSSWCQLPNVNCRKFFKSNLQQRWSQSAGRNIDVQDFMKFVSGLVFVGPWAAEDVLSPFISSNLSH